MTVSSPLRLRDLRKTPVSSKVDKLFQPSLSKCNRGWLQSAAFGREPLA